MSKQKQPTVLAVAQEAAILTVAVAIIAAAVYFFLVPSHASVSSISGLGIVLSNFVPLPLSAITMILNVVLLIIGFSPAGGSLGPKRSTPASCCRYSSACLSGSSPTSAR